VTVKVGHFARPAEADNQVVARAIERFEKGHGLRVVKLSSHRHSAAQYLPALNPHLTKSRLNDASRLCETLHRDFSRGGIERNKVELVWAQGE